MAIKQTLETSAERDAREAREKAAKDAKQDAKVADALAHETPEQRRKREAAEADEAQTVNQLGRIEEIRAELERAYNVYDHSTSQVFQRLQALVGGSNPVVAKAAKALAEEYDLKLNPHGFTQPPTPKGHHPFAEKS